MAAISFGLLSKATVFLICLLITAESKEVGVYRNVARTWCIASPFSPPAVLQSDIDTICNQIDCSSIQPGGACYDPNTVLSHASVALNLYYRAHDSQQSACGFPGAISTITDPSYGNCKFP